MSKYKVVNKLKSRKLWVTAAGMAAGVAASNPVLSVVLGAVYVIVQGVVDASPTQKEAVE